jgi:hypothetical protein
VERTLWSNDASHHPSTPWGAGLCIRRPVVLRYLRRLEEDPRRCELDVVGSRRVYGGDTDIAFTGCDMGLGKGVFADLKLRHLISERRCNQEYLVDATRGHGYSAVLHEYLNTGRIVPPRGDLPGRIARWARWFLSNPLDRRIRRAYFRGQVEAVRELSRIARESRSEIGR